MVIALEKPKLMFASFNGAQPELTGTSDLFFSPRGVYGAGDYVIALNADYQVAERFDVHTLQQTQFELEEPLHEWLEGEPTVYEGEQHVLLPAANGGLAMYNLVRSRLTGPIYTRPGPISDLAIVGNKLFVGGLSNPLDIFTMGPDGTPLERSTQYPGLRSVLAVDHEGDFLSVMYPGMNDVMLLDIGSIPFTMSLHFYVSGIDLRGVMYNDDKIDTLRSLFVWREFSVEGYTISDSNYVQRAIDLNSVDRINDIEVIDSMLFVSTGKSRVLVYRIFRDFDLSYQGALGLPREAPELQSWGNRLLVFVGEEMLVYDVSDPAKADVLANVQLPFSIKRAAIDGNWVIAIGPAGFLLIDMTPGTPEIIDYGGRGGYRVAAANGIVAISDGDAVHLYDMRGVITDIHERPDNLPLTFSLSQNYPNPFNPATSIEYTIPVRSHVRLSIFNILGREVTTLVDGERPAGAYVVEWDGRNQGGNSVATGVYFYRLVAEDFVETKKMILLK